MKFFLSLSIFFYRHVFLQHVVHTVLTKYQKSGAGNLVHTNRKWKSYIGYNVQLHRQIKGAVILICTIQSFKPTTISLYNQGAFLVSPTNWRLKFPRGKEEELPVRASSRIVSNRYLMPLNSNDHNLMWLYHLWLHEELHHHKPLVRILFNR